MDNFFTTSNGYNPATSQFIPQNSTGRNDFTYTINYATGCTVSTNFSIIVNAVGIGSCVYSNDTSSNFNNTDTNFNQTTTKDERIIITPPTFPIWGIILIIIGALVVIGVLALVIVLVLKNRGDKIPERIELNQINNDGSVSSVTATRDMILSGNKVGSKN